MKITLTFILLINFLILGICQEPEKVSFLVGLDMSADKVKTIHLKNTPLLLNFGLISELRLNEKWIIHLNISHYKRAYERKFFSSGLSPYDILNGTTSYLSELTTEKSIELENLLKYQFLHKKISPVFGLGYSIRFPYSVTIGVRYVHSDGTIEYIRSPQEGTWRNKFGLYSILGINYKVINKLNLTFDFGYKWYLFEYPPFIEIFTYNSLILSLGILYKI